MSAIPRHGDENLERLDEGVRSALAELRGRLAERFPGRLEQLVLFGSHARGTARPESDVDVLVVIGLTGRERGEVYETAADI